MWVYTSGPYERHQVRYFEYQPDRSGKHPAALLKEFEGRLVTGTQAMTRYPKRSAAAAGRICAGSGGRAMPRGATSSTSKAAIGYEYCNKLFALERKYEGCSPKHRQEMRQAQTEPVLDAYWAWVEKLDPEPGSKLEDAVKYATNQKQALNTFLHYGDVEISNNLAENAIRPFVVGRKNWLFCDTPKGAEASTIVYSLVETAKANNVEPFAYLSFILDEIRWLGKTPPAVELDALLPWNPALRKKLEN